MQQLPVVVVKGAVIFRKCPIEECGESHRHKQAQEFRQYPAPGRIAPGPIDAGGCAAMHSEQENIGDEIGDRQTAHANQGGVDRVLHFQQPDQNHRADKSQETGGDDPQAGGGLGQRGNWGAGSLWVSLEGGGWFVGRRRRFHSVRMLEKILFHGNGEGGGKLRVEC